MSEILLISCVQEDIVCSNENGKEIVFAINSFIEQNSSLKIVLINDWHNKNNKIFDKEEKHCIKGSLGAKIYKGLNVVENQCKILYKGMSEDSKNAFFEEGCIHSKLEAYLNENNVKKIFICGFEVEETIKTALEKQFEVEVIENATYIVEKKKKKKKEIDNDEKEDIIQSEVNEDENKSESESE